jgi:hypothetical protein
MIIFEEYYLLGYNVVESQPTFRRNISPPTCFHSGFLFGKFFDPEDGGDVPPKRRLIFNGLYGVISQKIVLFITTDVRTSNPLIIFVAHFAFS